MAETRIRVPLDRYTLFHGPHNVAVEASGDVIFEQHLDEWEGEHIQRIEDVLSVTPEDSDIVFETCRTIRNRGRYTVRIPRSAIASITAAPAA